MKLLLRCGGSLNLPDNKSNCAATVEVPTTLLPFGMIHMAVELQRTEKWRFSTRTKLDGEEVLQPVCPECSDRRIAGGPE